MKATGIVRSLDDLLDVDVCRRCAEKLVGMA